MTHYKGCPLTYAMLLYAQTCNELDTASSYAFTMMADAFDELKEYTANIQTSEAAVLLRSFYVLESMYTGALPSILLRTLSRRDLAQSKVTIGDMAFNSQKTLDEWHSHYPRSVEGLCALIENVDRSKVRLEVSLYEIQLDESIAAGSSHNQAKVYDAALTSLNCVKTFADGLKQHLKGNKTAPSWRAMAEPATDVLIIANADPHAYLNTMRTLLSINEGNGPAPWT